MFPELAVLEVRTLVEMLLHTLLSGEQSRTHQYTEMLMEELR